jgi:hypothetical protein
MDSSLGNSPVSGDDPVVQKNVHAMAGPFAQ